MSISNRLFKIIFEEFKTKNDYKELKDHVNEVFSKFSGNKLSNSKNDKFNSLLFGSNNPNIISKKFDDLKLEHFHKIKEKIQSDFKGMLIAEEYDHNECEKTIQYYSVFIPLFENEYYNKKNIASGNVYIGIRIILCYENESLRLTFDRSLLNFYCDRIQYSEYSSSFFKTKDSFILLDKDSQHQLYKLKPENFKETPFASKMIKHYFLDFKSHIHNKKLTTNSLQKLIIKKICNEEYFYLESAIKEFFKEPYTKDENALNNETKSFVFNHKNNKKDRFVAIVEFCAPLSLANINGESPYYKNVIESESEIEIRLRIISFFKSIETKNECLIKDINNVIKGLEKSSCLGMENTEHGLYDIGFNILNKKDFVDI